MIGRLYPLVISAVAAAALITGCGSDSNSSGGNNVGAIPAAGSLLPYTVLRDDLADGANPGSTFEVRNGGFGSAAAADPKNKNRFYAMTDRGPNATYEDGKMFPTPDYTPRIGLFEIKSNGSVSMVKEILLKDTDGNLISGLPNSSDLGGTGEKPYDASGTLLVDGQGNPQTDDFGLDSEGLAVMNDGTFWVSDEYGPHMVHFDANGKEIGRINPFAADTRNIYTLPAEFGNRWANRGMEGLTVTPDQKTLVGIMQSTLDNPSKDFRGTLTRIVTVDLETGAMKQYLYKQEKAKNSNSEITAIGNDTFLVIERDGTFYKDTTDGQKHVYKIKLSTGTDLESIPSATGSSLYQDPALGLTIDGLSLEEYVFSIDGMDGWDALASKGIVPVQKELVVDMIKENQYPHDKMEGLIVFDENTLGILNDDDFATWATGGVLEQKYLDAAKSRVDGNTLYVVKGLELSGVSLSKLGAYNTGKEGGSEISAYDSASKRLFITNGADNKLDIVNIADVSAPALVTSVDLAPYGAGVQSVATKNGKVAVAVGAADKTGAVGKVVVLDVDGNFVSQTQVGYLPDMVTFTENGSKILVANEGEPDAASGTYVDVKGSVGMITVTAATAADDAAGYAEIDFSSATLTAASDGTPVRLGGTPSNDQALDIEPEYITVSGDYAYVTLQENNAVAKVNVSGAAPMLEWVKSLGAKSYEADSGNTIDIEEEGDILMKSYPGLFGLYMPDTIASYTVGGETYFVTANEGDGREYCADTDPDCDDPVFLDEKKIGKLDLDASIADAYADENDLKVMIDMGDEDNNGIYEKLYTYGARSFTIWNSEGELVYDSGDAISKKIAEIEPALFNQDDGEMDGRSGNKGGEPEALALATIGDKSYAFVGLERQSAIVIYDVTDPMNAKYVDYVVTHTQGDVSPEGMFFVPADKAPNGKNLLIVSYEVSGSTVIYEITQ